MGNNGIKGDCPWIYRAESLSQSPESTAAAESAHGPLLFYGLSLINLLLIALLFYGDAPTIFKAYACRVRTLN